jgi:hypothetical protein
MFTFYMGQKEIKHTKDLALPILERNVKID